jgi:hypothetical protein
VTAGITILPILQKAAALAILPQIQRIYLGHLHCTAEAGKYNSQNLRTGYILVACEMVEVDRGCINLHM